MPAKKKAKGKTKAKRKKPPVTKATTRRKTAARKKPAKKGLVRREVGPNDDFGLKVVDHVREHDVVYKVRP
jgi:hypothetical protein